MLSADLRDAILARIAKIPIVKTLQMEILVSYFLLGSADSPADQT